MSRRTRSLYDEVGNRKTIAIVDEKPRGKSCFQGGKFMLVAMDTYKILYQMDLPHSAEKIMHWLCAHNEYGNTIFGWTQDEIARDCKTHRTHVSRMLGELQRQGLIIHTRNSVVILNPYLWYRGALEAQREACDSWDERRRTLGMVTGPVAVAQ